MVSSSHCQREFFSIFHRQGIELGLEGFNGVFFSGVGSDEVLVVVEIDEVGRLVILASLAAFWAIPSKVSYFSALEACI